MNTTRLRFFLLLILGLLAACSTAPKKDLALERVRAQLAQLQADHELVGYAPLALGEAERSLRDAEQAEPLDPNGTDDGFEIAHPSL